MPVVTWKFSICGKTGYSLEPTSIGIDVSLPSEVEAIGKAAGFEVSGWDRGNESYRKIEVDDPEGSYRLLRLLKIIQEKFGFVPSMRKIVPESERGKVFDVSKLRKYSKKEIQICDYLCISFTEKIIAEHLWGSEEDIEKERYLVQNHKKKTSVLMGCLSPFPAIAVSGELKLDLEQAGLIGLTFEPVINGDDIWKPTSSIMMPQCLLPLVDGSGAIVGADDWPDKWSDKYYDDGGYEPPEMRYNKEEIGQLEPFDFAITAERTGGIKATSFRRYVVSQRFKNCLDKLKVRGVRYTPVRIE